MKLIDTHCHLICEKFKDNLDAIIAKAAEKNILIITCGTDFTDSRAGIELAKKNKNIFASAGFCPHEVEKNTYFKDELLLLLSQRECCAIGECGLDYYYYENGNDQLLVLESQITLAKEYNLPLILHCRDAKDNPDIAHKDLYALLKKYGLPHTGVIHSFTGSLEYAKKFIDLGYFIGINGIVTFNNASNLQNIVRTIDVKNILLETDSPFLAPVPMRGKINQPSYLNFIAEKIAILKNMDIENIAKITCDNAVKLFNIK